MFLQEHFIRYVRDPQRSASNSIFVLPKRKFMFDQYAGGGLDSDDCSRSLEDLEFRFRLKSNERSCRNTRDLFCTQIHDMHSTSSLL